MELLIKPQESSRGRLLVGLGKGVLLTFGWTAVMLLIATVKRARNRARWAACLKHHNDSDSDSDNESTNESTNDIA